jgi:hypothetical protein
MSSVEAAMNTTLSSPQTAAITLDGDSVDARAVLRITPLGLLAIGGLVAAILLSVPPIIRAAADARARGG